MDYSYRARNRSHFISFFLAKYDHNNTTTTTDNNTNLSANTTNDYLTTDYTNYQLLPMYFYNRYCTWVVITHSL